MTPEQFNLQSITCPQCKMTSHNPNDIEWGWCGNCNGYTSPVNPLMKAMRFIEESKAAAAAAEAAVVDLPDNMEQQDASDPHQ